MTRYAVVDLEATDAHSRDNKIIQIGITLIEDGAITKTYASNVNPHEKLAYHIKELTGLKDKDLKKAPDFSDIAKDVHRFIGDAVFVAHNAKFDYELLSKSLFREGLSLDLARVDTVDLVRVFYPSFERYGLEFLGEALDLSHDRPHEALSDAYATAELLLKIQERARKLPTAVLEEILRHADNLLYETKDFLREQLAYTSEKPKGMKVLGNLATVKTRRPRLSKRAKALTPDFDENIQVLGLKKREQQADLASCITKELAEAVPSFIEAATGTGKTYAYLLSFLAEGRRLVVSTPTKILQEQLMSSVAPQLKGKFGTSFAKLIGTQNYLSLEKFSRALRDNTEGKNFEIFKMKVLVWLTESRTGDLSELSTTLTNKDYFDEIAHDGVWSERELHAKEDFWMRAQKEAKQADVIVVNHAYLIERLADYPETFLEDRVLVVDEAQQLFAIMENLNQKSVKLTDELIKVDASSSHLVKRLQESLVYQLSKKELDIEKINMDATELGLTELSDLTSDSERFVWIEDNRIISSTTDFYDFAKLIPSGTKTYMLGASLSLSDDDPVFPGLLGFSHYDFFKFPSQQVSNQKISVILDGPPVKNTTNLAYAQYLAEKAKLLSKKKLPILMLFTSRQSLIQTAEEMTKLKLNFLAQDIQGTAEQVKRKFDKGEAQILMGLGSFWEGVDFAQQDRLLLMIARLPFATPEDILTKKYASRFKNPFYDFNVPMASLKIQQAMGRINRRPEQKSQVFIMDDRLAGKSYAKKMRRHLEKIAPLNCQTFAEAMGDLKKFLL
ncbi:helicase C-terminal domain-containing protein [Lactococcus termiticola]|uniref:3'-5' exonuclease DinG n=1 Tax=Lactococcus termiticola TaxID=2169526 RepID=A0A2R5HDS4_9LACT|nr:helicase C-terminal domain-containing protein [Lactococcus termiticola]GBG96234.1 ATP-dependent helicase [Lactococcus termiticola]